MLLLDEEFIKIYRDKEAEHPDLGKPLDNARMENIAYLMHMAMNSAKINDLDHARKMVAYAVLWASNEKRFIADKIEEHQEYLAFNDPDNAFAVKYPEDDEDE